MKIKKGTILNLGLQNPPVPGCTISEEIYRDPLGQQAITLFSLAQDTSISAERYPHPSAYLTLSGKPSFVVPAQGLQLAAPQGSIVVTDGSVDFGVNAPATSVYLEIALSNNTTMNKIIKNREVFKLKDLLPYQDGKIVNMDIASNPNMKFVVMSFDAGTGLRPHAAPGDALLTCLDGEAVITYEGKDYNIHEGEQFVFEKGGQHAVKAVTKFKMSLLLTLGE